MATTGPGDTDVTGTDADTSNPCGQRECGTFAGQNCGTCTGTSVCNAAGRCVVPGAPLGSFCGISPTCTSSSPSYPDCIDDQCESRQCLSNSGAVFLLRDVCTSGCQIHKDTNGDGVNDSDAPLSDCNPSDVVDGPAGDVFRCVNYAGPGQNPVGICTPTTAASVDNDTAFKNCQSDLQCPAGEGCELTTIGGDLSFRCVAKVKAGPWGEAAGLSETCNDDPAEGPVSFCESGLCFGIGCVSVCEDGNDAACDTTKVYEGTGCDTTTNTCKGKPSKSCTADVDCSGWTCGEARSIFSNVTTKWRFCWPTGCDVDGDCGAGFYCRFFWNGEGGDAAALDNMCLKQVDDGAELGEACDSNPDDLIPGDTCKNEDLCLGGFCSALCRDNDDCADSQICAVSELPGDEDDDGEDDFVLPVKWCEVHSRTGTACLSQAECQAGEYCDIYEIENPDTANAADAPYLLRGVCTPAPAQTADWGALCSSGAACKSGFCLGASTTSQGFCTKPCAASSECEQVNLGGEQVEGVCTALLYSFGGKLDYDPPNLYLAACYVEASSTADCSADFTCSAANEACLVNPILTSPDKAPSVEYLCQALYDPTDPPTTLPTKDVGDACDLDAEDFECKNAYCLEGADGNGYCSAPCDPATDTAANNGTTCQKFINRPRVGFYADNAAVFYLWQKDLSCAPCAGPWNCEDGATCENAGTTANPRLVCVDSGSTAAACNQ